MDPRRQRLAPSLRMSRLAFRCAHYARRVYWRVFRPRTRGVRGVLLDSDERILLVRHTYDSGWYLPGGSVKRMESPLDALSRELREEVGVSFAKEALSELGKYSARAEGKRDEVTVYVLRS